MTVTSVCCSTCASLRRASSSACTTTSRSTISRTGTLWTTRSSACGTSKRSRMWCGACRQRILRRISTVSSTARPPSARATSAETICPTFPGGNLWKNSSPSNCCHTPRACRRRRSARS
eukprot:Amastigsp_a676390_54.p4 type:complete len:119 gc:universal Amastigsp_a676390_54:656-300(-)